MKAIIVKSPGGVEQLELVEIDIPKPRKGELLVKVQAAALNRTDIVTRETTGRYPATPVLGVEISGIVVDSNGNRDFSNGDEIMGLVNGGGYADYALIPANRAMRKPNFLSFIQAAGIPEVFLTAYQTLFWIGKLKKEEIVLIHAGASGVGTAAIQLAKQVCGSKVIVTAGSEEKLQFCKSLGADVLINYKKEAFDKEIFKATGDKGADLILDFVGASYWEKNLLSIREEGRWVLIGILGGRELEKIDLFEIMRKRIQITGTLLTPRSDDYKSKLSKEFYENIIPYFENKNIRPIIDRVFDLKDAKKAQIYMEENHNVGKIILNISNK